MKLRLTQLPLARRRAGFTMVEIALCLAIIGFALVAIVGILPIGMAVQKDNREETLINQDATYLLEAIRGGAQGVDMLTNYVEYIAIYRRQLNALGVPVGAVQTDVYTNLVPAPSFKAPAVGAPLTNGQQIVGLLSRPKYEGTTSNYVVAVMRAISGPATEKGINTSSRDFAFHYRVVSEVVPAGLVTRPMFRGAWQPPTVAFNWSLTNGLTNSEQKAPILAQYDTLRNLSNNLHEIRLLYRWPVRPNGTIGGGRQTYRALAGGSLVSTNAGSIYFFQPANYSNYKPN